MDTTIYKSKINNRNGHFKHENTFGVIIPVYNTEEWLGDCLNSIVNQTVPFDEVVIVNDGSTDNSLKICEEYSARYDNFKIITQENRGLSAARNVGINAINCDYIFFLDSDDCLAENAVEKIYPIIMDIDAVYFDAEVFGRENFIVNKKTYIRKLRLHGFISGKEMFKAMYPKNYFSSVCLAVYRLSSIKENNVYFPEGLLFEDNYFTLAFMLRQDKVMYIPDVLYRRRYRENSITTGRYSDKKFNSLCRIVNLMYSDIQKCFLEDISYISGLIIDYCLIICDRYLFCINNNIVLSDGTMANMSETIILFNQLSALFYRIKGQKHQNNTIRLFCALSELNRNGLYYNNDLYRELYDYSVQFYKKLLMETGLTSARNKIGIYGTGKHTNGMLSIYQQLYGIPKAEIIFIESEPKNELFGGRKVISYKDIDSSFDKIIISTVKDNDEIEDNIRSANNIVPVLRFYNDTDTSSLFPNDFCL